MQLSKTEEEFALTSFGVEVSTFDTEGAVNDTTLDGIADIEVEDAALVTRADVLEGLTLEASILTTG